MKSYGRIARIVVKGDKFKVARAMADAGIPFAFVKQAGVNTVGDVGKQHIPRLSKFLNAHPELEGRYAGHKDQVAANLKRNPDYPKPGSKKWLAAKASGPRWRYQNGRGIWHEGYVERVVDLGGTDITHYMRDAETGELSLLSGSRLKAASVMRKNPSGAHINPFKPYFYVSIPRDYTGDFGVDAVTPVPYVIHRKKRLAGHKLYYWLPDELTTAPKFGTWIGSAQQKTFDGNYIELKRFLKTLL